MTRTMVSAMLACWMAPTLAGNSQVQEWDLAVIVVSSEAKAADLRAQVQAGASFEALAILHSSAPSASAGGYIGRVSTPDLRAELQAALSGLRPGDLSAITPIGKEFVVLRVATPDEQVWRDQNNAGFRALEAGHYMDATPLFLAAIEKAEKFGQGDYRLAQSLSGLAHAYQFQNKKAESVPLFQQSLAISEKNLGSEHPHLLADISSLAEIYGNQGNYADAQPLYGRTLAILEKFQGPNHPSVAVVLNNLALTYDLQGNYEQAESLLSRSLTILEKAAGPEDPSLIGTLNKLARIEEKLDAYPEAERLYWRILSLLWGGRSSPDSAGLAKAVLENFANVFNLAYFAAPQLSDALGKYKEALRLAQPGEVFYFEMRDELVAANLMSEAEWVMLAAVQAFPDSVEVRYGLGGLYVYAGRHERALEVFEEASRLKRPSDPNLYRLRRSSIFARIGEMHAFLGRFDKAEEAFMASLELNPDNVESHVALGNLYFLRDLPEKAVSEYTRAVAGQSNSAPAYYGLAEANLRLGRFSESAAAARKALEIDPELRSARYSLGLALARDGHIEEAEMELEKFRNAEARASVQRGKEIALSRWEAVEKFKAGYQNDAIESLRHSIDAYPDVAELYVGLGLIQSRIGSHQAAVKTFTTMIDKGWSDVVLVHRNLAAEYAALGDAQSSQRHRAIYLREYVGALERRAN